MRAVDEARARGLVQVNGARCAAATAGPGELPGLRGRSQHAVRRERERSYTRHLDSTADDPAAARLITSALAHGLSTLRLEVETYWAQLSTDLWNGAERVFCMGNGPDGAFCAYTSGHPGWHAEAGMDGLRWGGPGQGEGMTATTYYAMADDEQLAAAQRSLDTHTVSSTGYCLACQILGPCRPREIAESIFYRSLRLPRRHPGATHPELLGARLVGAGRLG